MKRTEKNNLPFDVFLSHASDAAAIAEVVRNAFEEQGLRTFPQPSFVERQNNWDAARDALAESLALVLIITPLALRSPRVTIEVGAAISWDKPVFVLLENVLPKALPPFLAKFQTFPMSKWREVVKHVVRATAAAPLTEAQQEAVTKTYRELGVPVDDLSFQPDVLDRLTESFNEVCATQFASERVLQELLRMRKSRKLPPLRKRVGKTGIAGESR